MATRWSVVTALGLLALVATACGVLDRLAPEATVVPVPTVAPTPVPSPTAVPRTADEVAGAFFRAWEQQAWVQMYEWLSEEARAETTEETFVRRYRLIHEGIEARRISIQASPAREEGPARPAVDPRSTARVAFQITREVPLLGALNEGNELELVREPDGWRVAWTAGVIFRDLTATSTVRFTTLDAQRGRILDRHGQPLAEQGTVLSVGVVPGRVEDEEALLRALSETLELPPETIKQRYQGGQPDWFMPITDRPTADRPRLAEALGTVAGAVVQENEARVYPLGEAAAHLVGYVSRVTADDLQRLAEKRYGETDWVGRTGVEAWGEAHLAGEKGARLTIVDQGGQTVRTVAEKQVVPGADVRLTVDAEVQAKASELLGERAGSVVVLDPRDNGLLAIASRPTFDPNQLVIGLSQAQWEALNGPQAPLQFRAAESVYAAASTFKVITMAAGMERIGVRTADRFDCGMEWHGLPGVTLHNWTAQGTLDLIESLSQSCNPAFYEIGLRLDQEDPTILPEFARAFGLGQPTGVEGIYEVDGTVPDPAWKRQALGEPWTHGDAVNLAIGQGYLQVSPLQMANAYSALANGGTLRRPLLVQAITPAEGAERAFAGEEVGQLPLGEATRAAIMEGMKRVTGSANGSASAAFQGSQVPTAAKTGSAENEGPDAHAWFIGYRMPEEPSALVLVMVEGGQMSATTAAPLGREMLDFVYPLTR